MHFHDPNRPKSPGGKPAWTELPDVALPVISVMPHWDGGWRVSVFVTSGDFVARQHLVLMKLEELPSMLLDWVNGPEEALERWFGVTAPKRQSRLERPPAISTGLDLDELF